MDIRCPSCSKLFRVADEKIAGKGIRFKCSKCAEVITITKDDFEMDVLAREDDAAQPVTQQPVAQQPAKPAAKPSAPAAPESSIKPVPQQPIPPSEPEAREYKPPPPQDEDIPPAGLSDFDFSEPHAAATAAGQADQGFGGQDFSFDVEPEQDQEAVPEVAISPEAAAEAEAALQFPDDLISEPKRKPVFGAPSASETAADKGPEQEPAGKPMDGPAFALPPSSKPAPEMLGEEEMDLGAALRIPSVEDEPGPEPRKETKQQPPRSVSQVEVPKTGPVFTPPPRPKPTPEKHDEDEMDLGAALRIPQASSGGASFDASKGAASSASSSGKDAIQTGPSGEIHPLASGNATGAVAGLGCALPLVALMTVGFGMMTKFLPFFAGLPLWQLAVIAGMGTLSMGVVIGIMISVAQARAGKKLFFLVNILIGTAFGAGLGATRTAIKSLVLGSPLNLPLIVADTVAMAAFAFMLSILVVIARRVMVHTKEETFSAALNGLQKAGIAASVLVFLAAGYALGTFSGNMERSVKDAMQRPENAAKGVLISPEGLQVINSHGYFDPATGDLIITGFVKNNADRPKAGWYLAIEVRDARESVLSIVRMVNGIQIYSKADEEILAKRGAAVEQFQKQIASLGGGMIMPKGSVAFTVRIINPPAGSAGFLPMLRAFDIATLGEVTREGMERK